MSLWRPLSLLFVHYVCFYHRNSEVDNIILQSSDHLHVFSYTASFMIVISVLYFHLYIFCSSVLLRVIFSHLNIEKDIQDISNFVYFASFIISFFSLPIEPLILFAGASCQNGFMYLMLLLITKRKGLTSHRLTFQPPCAAYYTFAHFTMKLRRYKYNMKLRGNHQIEVSCVYSHFIFSNGKI